MALGKLQTHWCPKAITYSGKELRPHFLLSQFKLRGSAVGSFLGPCKVETKELVDWEDRMEGDCIEAASMIHFLGEFFGPSLTEAVLIQRRLVTLLKEVLEDSLDDSFRGKGCLKQSGNDLYWVSGHEPAERKKLSVSIVASTPVSQLLHLGVNWDAAGAPVAAFGIAELCGYALGDLDSARYLSERLMKSLQGEWESVDWSCAKVRPVL